MWPLVVAAWRAARNGVANMATLIVLSVGTGNIFSHQHCSVTELAIFSGFCLG